MTPDQLQSINNYWNKHIRYKQEPHGRDSWQLPQDTIELGHGDCEDIALVKMFYLIDKIDPNSLFLTYVFTPCKSAHMVLMYNDYVLDTLDIVVKPFVDTVYQNKVYQIRADGVLFVDDKMFTNRIEKFDKIRNHINNINNSNMDIICK